MTMGALAACFILTLLIAWLVSHPLLADKNGSVRTEEISSASLLIKDQRERCHQMLRDLELDFATKKVSEEEYASMKAQSEEELSKLGKD